MSSLRDKLYNYEQTPPENTWEKIAAALDESNLTDEFPSKLYSAEVTPPASAWDKIAGSLDKEHGVVIPMRNKSFVLFRYAAAVVIIGLITFGIFKWTDSSKNQPEINELAVKDSTPDNKTTVLPEENNITKADPPNGNPDTEENTLNIANTEKVRSARIKKTGDTYAIRDKIGATQPVYAYHEQTTNPADRYVMLMTPDGNIIRMSKKWGDLVCCVSGEEQDDNCKDQLKKWQEKIASLPVASSPGNFMDILSMVSSLDTDL